MMQGRATGMPSDDSVKMLQKAVCSVINETLQCYQMGINDEYPLQQVLCVDVSRFLGRVVDEIYLWAGLSC